VRFGSREWIEAIVSALNAQPDLARALIGLGADAAFVVEADRPRWPADVAAYARQERGRVATWRLLADPDDVLELEPAYVVRAPYAIWRGLLNGEDPVKAALSGRVRVEGDLEALVRRSGYRHVIDAALGAVVTEFP
jgi:SCP-2 sterol transfer family